MNDDKDVVLAGKLRGSGFQVAVNVYDINGVAPTLTTTHPGIGLPKIEVAGDLHLEQIAGTGKRNNHANDVLGVNGICTCLTAAMGEGGGHIPKIEISASERILKKE